MSKAHILNDYQAFISDPFSRVRPSLASFLRSRDDWGGVKEFAFDDNIVVEQTSGTSGTALRCPKTLTERVRLGVGIWNQRRALDPQAKPSDLYPFIHCGVKPPSLSRWDCRMENLMALYHEVRHGRYRWIHAVHPMLQCHVEVFQREGWRPVLPDLAFIECNGLYLRDGVASELAHFFGVPIVDHYGMMEAWTTSMTCVHGVHHVNDDNVQVEILNDSAQPVRPNEVGRIVVTSLQERLMPFVRYVTSDFGAYVDKVCDCRLGTTTLRLTEGREEERIRGVAGPVFGNIVFRRVLERLTCPDLKHIRIVQPMVGEFVVYTNSLLQPFTFLQGFQRLTQELPAVPFTLGTLQ